MKINQLYNQMMHIPYTKFWMVTASSKDVVYDTIRVSITDTRPTLTPELLGKLFITKPETIDVEEVGKDMYDRLSSYKEFILIGDEFVNV